jgi:hypothetical protein
MTKLTIYLVLFAAALGACGLPQAPKELPTAASPNVGLPTAMQKDTETPTAPTATVFDAKATPEEPIRFAVIGDYGQAGVVELAVAAMIEDWQVDFIVTTGDNNYPVGEAQTIDENIGQYYHAYIGKYLGEYGSGSQENRFFPSIGNHDWTRQAGYGPYLEYFSLPGNERYYDFEQGTVHFFILNSDPNEPDGVGRSSVQAEWLRTELADSTAAWQVVVMHHPAYSSGRHTSTEWMQWPFGEWGTDIALAGHDHWYERLEVDGLPYLTNGLGGSPSRYGFSLILPESLVRYNEMHGAMLVEATRDWMRFDFINLEGELIDRLTLIAACSSVFPFMRIEQNSFAGSECVLERLAF